MPVAYQHIVESLAARQTLQKNSFIDDKYCKIKEEWTKFIAGENKINLAVVPEDILNTWQRYRKSNLDPFNREIPKLNIVRGNDREKLLNDNKELIDISRPFLDNLYEFVKDSGFSIALFNAGGWIIDARYDDAYLKKHQFSRWHIGVQWREKTVGTNIVSFVLEQAKPCQLFGPHHYKEIYHYVTASGAPIFNPEGKLIGGLAVSSHFYASNDHTLGMAVAAVHAITNEFRTQRAVAEREAAHSQTDMAFSLQKTILAAIPEALIAIDDGMHITLINEQARKKFSLQREEIEGKLIEDVFPGKENQQFLNMIRNNVSLNDTEVRIVSRTSNMDCLLTGQPIISSGGKIVGKILIFAEIKRIKSLVAKMIGAKANFRFEDICGANPRFLSSIEQACTVSKSDSTVMLLGESGTGKDLFAQAIHNASSRKNGPYVAINCGAIPRDLVTSELFGHSEGAFTGSRRGGNQGKFQLADGGTIFLDEIAEMPLELQTALLRVIEDRAIIPIGGTRIHKVDVRIIAATNKDLETEVNRGNFRKDLYYRTNVFTIHLLPLSERLDDIPLLVDRFIKKYGNTMRQRIDKIDKKLMDTLVSYPWPGNVRELQNVIERMMNMARDNELTLDPLPPEILHFRQAANYKKEIESTEDFERYTIVKMMRMNLSKTEIARKMNITRSTLYNKISKYNLS